MLMKMLPNPFCTKARQINYKISYEMELKMVTVDIPDKNLIAQHCDVTFCLIFFGGGILSKWKNTVSIKVPTHE
jgi:hypothetical protein